MNNNGTAHTVTRVGKYYGKHGSPEGGTQERFTDGLVHGQGRRQKKSENTHNSSLHRIYFVPFFFLSNRIIKVILQSAFRTATAPYDRASSLTGSFSFRFDATRLARRQAAAILVASRGLQLQSGFDKIGVKQSITPNMLQKEDAACLCCVCMCVYVCVLRFLSVSSRRHPEKKKLRLQGTKKKKEKIKQIDDNDCGYHYAWITPTPIIRYRPTRLTKERRKKEIDILIRYSTAERRMRSFLYLYIYHIYIYKTFFFIFTRSNIPRFVSFLLFFFVFVLFNLYFLFFFFYPFFPSYSPRSTK